MGALTNGIPEKTIERLSEYRRTLLASHRQGITHIFSHVLAGIHGITAVQVRRDLRLRATTCRCSSSTSARFSTAPLP